MTSLYEISKDYQQALLALADLEDIDESVINDTLEGLEGIFENKAVNVAAYMLNLEAEADLVRQAEDRMKARRKAIEARSQALRDYLLRNMQACGITEIKAIDGSFRARLMAGRESVVVDDEKQLPAYCLREKYIVEPDKTAILKALKSGDFIPGAHIERKPALKID